MPPVILIFIWIASPSTTICITNASKSQGAGGFGAEGAAFWFIKYLSLGISRSKSGCHSLKKKIDWYSPHLLPQNLSRLYALFRVSIIFSILDVKLPDGKFWLLSW